MCNDIVIALLLGYSGISQMAGLEICILFVVVPEIRGGGKESDFECFVIRSSGFSAAPVQAA